MDHRPDSVSQRRDRDPMTTPQPGARIGTAGRVALVTGATGGMGAGGLRRAFRCRMGRRPH